MFAAFAYLFCGGFVRHIYQTRTTHFLCQDMGLCSTYGYRIITLQTYVKKPYRLFRAGVLKLTSKLKVPSAGQQNSRLLVGLFQI